MGKATRQRQILLIPPAGVPLRDTVAGVAMGLILQPDGRFTILTDILGSEDALGDMDFKVAGTETGVTAFQMDIKVKPVTLIPFPCQRPSCGSDVLRSLEAQIQGSRQSQSCC